MKPHCPSQRENIPQPRSLLLVLRTKAYRHHKTTLAIVQRLSREVIIRGCQIGCLHHPTRMLLFSITNVKKELRSYVTLSRVPGFVSGVFLMSVIFHRLVHQSINKNSVHLSTKFSVLFLTSHGLF